MAGENDMAGEYNTGVVWDYLCRRCYGLPATHPPVPPSNAVTSQAISRPALVDVASRPLEVNSSGPACRGALADVHLGQASFPTYLLAV